MDWKLTHPVVYPTVDCAIFEDILLSRLYLAKKPGETRLRFVGGFVDPSDPSYAVAALREAKEETRLDCRLLGYIMSSRIDDPRYSDKQDKIITSFYAMVPTGNGVAKASDDISELGLYDVDSLSKDDFVPEHQGLFEVLVRWLDGEEIKEPA